MVTLASRIAATVRRVLRLGKVPAAIASALVALAAGLHAEPASAFVQVSGEVTPGGFTCGVHETYNDGGSNQLFATGHAQADPRFSNCSGNGYATSTASESRGEFTALAVATPTAVARATSSLSVNVFLNGPPGVSSVTDVFDMVVSGDTSEPLPQAAPYVPAPTSYWTACITLRSPDLGGGLGVQSFGCGQFGKRAGDGSSFEETESLTATVPMHTDPGATFSKSDPIFSIFTIEGLAVGREGPSPSDPRIDLRVPGDIDLSHTALIRQTLPPGFSFTSDSGVFLSESPFNTPEPATAVLFGGGLTALAYRRPARTRRSKRL